MIVCFFNRFFLFLRFYSFVVGGGGGADLRPFFGDGIRDSSVRF